jgi:phosphatidate cytidylyltransferase
VALKKYNNLTQRIITGILGAAGIITGVWYGPYTYFAIFFLICLLSLIEFYKLIGMDGMVPQRKIGILCGILIFTLTFFVEFEQLNYKYYFLIYPLIACVYLAKLYKKNEKKPFTNIAFTFLGIIYVAVPLALFNIAAFEKGQYNFEIIWGCLFILWACDTGAYFAGTFFGKRKLFERISPKKSWEGFFGGAALALAFAFGIAHFFHSYTTLEWMIIGVIIIIAGTYGDLVESLLKRSIEIKDSGNILPGHGGFLDRFDGLLIAIPFIVVYVELLR